MTKDNKGIDLSDYFSTPTLEEEEKDAKEYGLLLLTILLTTIIFTIIAIVKW